MQITFHFEEGMNVPLPLMSPSSWMSAEMELIDYLLASESPAQEGDRFLVGRITRIEPQPVYFEYILTWSQLRWHRHVSIWASQCPYDYDFDVFAVRPMEDVLG